MYNSYRIKDEGFDYYHEVEFYFQAFQFYIKEINQLIEQEISKAKENFNALEKENEANPENEYEWIEGYVELHSKAILTDIYYDSLITAIYSFIEKKMRVLCKYLSKSQSLKPDDINGRGIKKYQTYLSKVCKIDFSLINNEWQTLMSYNELRNYIVHSEGGRSIPKSETRLIDFLKTINGVKLIDEPQTNSYTFHFETTEILTRFILIAMGIMQHLFYEKG